MATYGRRVTSGDETSGDAAPTKGSGDALNEVREADAARVKALGERATARWAGLLRRLSE